MSVAAATCAGGLLALSGIEASLRTPRPAEASPQAIAAGIRRSLVILQEDGQDWMDGRIPIQDGRGCVSCHQVPFGVWSLHEAERAGIVLDAARAAELTRQALDFVALPRKARAMSWGPLVLATSNGSTVASRADFNSFAVDTQTAPGHWEAKGQFPEQRRSLEETNAVATMWTMLAMWTSESIDSANGIESYERGYRSVESFGAGESTEWLLLRSLVEQKLGQEPAARELVDRLVAQQNPDGGWSWLPGEESNAFSTGQVLYALLFEGSTASERHETAIARGTTYLVETQAGEGHWAVPSRLTSRGAKPSKDYVYTYWGTAWATIGLARFLDRSQAERLGRLRERMTISLLGAPMSTVASYFAARLGAGLDLDPELASASVTLELDDQPLSLGLDALCDQSSCAWRIDTGSTPPRLQFVRRGEL
ncbi:MAG: hypothetical protein ACE5GX_08860 [Thermoanaerobaculia bacterium]